MLKKPAHLAKEGKMLSMHGLKTEEKTIAFRECYDAEHNRLIYKPKNAEAFELMDILHEENFLNEHEFENISWFLEKVGAKISIYENSADKKYL